MTYIDVFNGDADGICSLIQVRLAESRQSELVTGIKRDINLLKQVEAGSCDEITVLDISMQKNHADLQRILNAEARVFYADHHNPGDIPVYSNLVTHIDMSPSVCTALIIDKYLNGQFHLWAITAAYGDNLTRVADNLATRYGLGDEEASVLDDLFYHPAELYQECVQFRSPFDFIEQNKAVFDTLQKGYQQDVESARAEKPFHETTSVAALMLPDETWARRVSGVFSNQLSNENPDRAHVILTQKADGNFLVSIRAPLSQLDGADEVAGQFKTGISQCLSI